MRILFANVPFIKYDGDRIFTGPNAGSRWPWTMEGHHFHNYAPFPFWLAYGMKYVQSHGFDCHFYDGVARKHHDVAFLGEYLLNLRPEIIFFDVATPTYSLICQVADWAKRTFNCRIVFCGPHMKAYAEDCIKLPYVDHCIIGEYELAALDICQKLDMAKPIYRFELLDNIDTLPSGDNFLPHRPLDYLANYYDPSMNTERIQLTVSTSRGCPFKCTYCQWPNVINNGKYRARSPELVIDEIKEMKNILGEELRSIFFDDDTWNLGKSRIEKMCAGLKEIGLPWTMMGRIDTVKPELYHLIVDSGCVGMRFGVETFNQELADNVKKKLNVEVAYKNLKYIVENFSNLELHYTTMKNLPGEKGGSWQRDQQLLMELQDIGARRGNKVHWQISDCIPFPGTELWEELVQLGKGDSLRDFNLYDGSPANNGALERTVGWLGPHYRPKHSEYSKDGTPTNLPKE